MIDDKRKKEAQSNFTRYLQEGLLKKESNELTKNKYLENSDISLKTANELMQSPLKPYLWVIYNLLLYYVLHSKRYSSQLWLQNPG